MIFKKEILIDTKLSDEKIMERLNRVVKSYDNGNRKLKFEGVIDGNKFRLLQLFNYGPNNQLRPVVSGEIVSINNRTRLRLVFTLPSIMKRLIGFSFLMSSIVCVLSLTILEEKFPTNFGWIGLGFIIVLAVILPLNYLSKVDSCINEFLSLSNGRIVKDKTS